MGKKRRPNRKPNYEDLGDIQDRMAGEAVTDEDVIRAMGENVLSELRGEVAEDTVDMYVQEAMEYLPQRRAELSAMAAPYQVDFINKNLKNEEDLVRMAKIDTYLSDLGRMQGDVPMPIDRKTDANDRNSDRRTRVHVEYATNPITGQEQVVPFVDPNDSTKALKTEMGTHRRGQVPGGYDEAMEHLGANALALAGRTPMAGADNVKHRADIFNDDGSKVDVEFTGNYGPGKGVVPMQMYTSLQLASNKPLSEGEFRNTMKSLISQRAIDGNMSTVEAVESLVQDGIIRDSRTYKGVPYRQGKALKSSMLGTNDQNLGVSDERDIFDEIIFPGVDSYDKSKRGKKERKTLVQPVDSLHLLDLKKALNVLEEQVGAQERRSMPIDFNRPINYGGGDSAGDMRMKLYHDIPHSNSAVTDMLVEHPLTQQLLSSEMMKRRLI